MAKGDIFLKLTSKRAGVVRGEANDAEHGGEIDVLAWSWAIDFPTELRTGGRTGRSSLRAVSITKTCDVASTAIMSIACTNDEVKQAVLSVRKSGGSGNAIDYLTVELRGGYITGYAIEWQESPVPQLIERLDIRFKEIEINYSPQSAVGLKVGATSFSAEVTESV